jgi:tetrahydromethanopterin S-methyltransferase subunit G
MSMDIWVAVLALIGTLTGSLSGIVISAKLTNYRLEQLEKKVDKHNDFAARIPVIEEQIKVIHHRLDELERT